MPKEIVQKNDPVLRRTAEPVPLSDLGTPKLKKILKDMSTALAACEDGVAIAAPQIGVPLRIFVVAGKIFDSRSKSVTKNNDMVFINPTFVKLSSKKKLVDEGCLSVRWIYGKTKRAEKATVVAYNEAGEKFTKSGSGFLAQIFQHEIDHLNGILFIDHATNLEEVRPDDRK